MGLIASVILMTAQISRMLPHPVDPDFAFLVANEQFVREAIDSDRLADVLCPTDVALIGALGGDYQHRCRTAATVLRARGWDAVRALVWGTWSRNPGISDRSVGLLARLMCSRCRRIGWCPECGCYDQSLFICYCPICKGTTKL